MLKTLTINLKRQAHPLLVLAAGLLLIGLVTSLSGILHYQYELNHLSVPPVSGIAKASPAGFNQKSSDKLGQVAAQELASQNGQSGASGSSTVAKPSTTYSNSSVAAQPVGTGSVTGSPNAAAASSPASVEVSLSVNGALKGGVTLSSAGNQCDVLSQALKIGLISNLDMRYYPQYGSYAVYVISGIGDSDTVGWTYTVNGKLPPLGCTKMPVHAGDSINWQYVKN